VVERAQFGEEPARPPQDGHARRGERGRHRQVKRVGKVSGLASPTTHRAPRRHRSSGAARVHSHSVASRCGGTAAGKAAHPRHLRALLRAPPHAGTLYCRAASLFHCPSWYPPRPSTRHGGRTVGKSSHERYIRRGGHGRGYAKTAPLTRCQTVYSVGDEPTHAVYSWTTRLIPAAIMPNP